MQLQLLDDSTYFDLGIDLNYSFLTTKGDSGGRFREFRLVSKYNSYSIALI